MKKAPAAVTNRSDIRRQYLNHEAAIMMVGQWYYLIGLALALCAVTGFALKALQGSALSWGDVGGVAVVLVSLGALYAAVGYGFRKLNRWARYGGAVLALLCLASMKANPAVQGYASTALALVSMFALPIGIVITFYGAFLVMSPKGAIVFSKDYQGIVAETSEIQYEHKKFVVWAGTLLIAVQAFMLLAVFRVSAR